MLIVPFSSVGPVKVGMSAAEVSAVLGGVRVRFERMGAAFDAFEQASLQCEYDASERVVFIEVAEPGSAILGMQDLIGLSLPGVKAVLSDRGIAILGEDDESILGDGLVLAVAGDRVTSAAVFTEAYSAELMSLYPAT